jgi:hypothetical protein
MEETQHFGHRIRNYMRQETRLTIAKDNNKDDKIRRDKIILLMSNE